MTIVKTMIVKGIVFEFSGNILTRAEVLLKFELNRFPKFGLRPLFLHDTALR